MNGKFVGVLEKKTNGAHTFKYDAQWMQGERSRPLSLSLPFSTRTITSDHVINYFDNLLPDNVEVRNRIVARYAAASSQAFDLLQSIGRDCVGAISLLPPSLPMPDECIQREELSDARLEQILNAYKNETPLGMLDDEDDFRISIAGAQEKTALMKVDHKWYIPNGITPSTHILKLPIGEIQGPEYTIDLKDSVENEYLCMILAKELGFEVANVEIVRVGETKALVVERFDRKWVRDNSSSARGYVSSSGAGTSY